MFSFPEHLLRQKPLLQLLERCDLTKLDKRSRPKGGLASERCTKCGLSDGDVGNPHQ